MGARNAYVGRGIQKDTCMYVCVYIYINCITILSQDTPYNKLLKYQSFTCLNIPRESVVGMKSDV